MPIQEYIFGAVCCAVRLSVLGARDLGDADRRWWRAPDEIVWVQCYEKTALATVDINQR